VVLIMGVVYSLVSANFLSPKAQATLPTLTIENLPAFMRGEKGVTRTFYLLGDKCDKALFDPPFETLEFEHLRISPATKSYVLDFYGALQVAQFGRFALEGEEVDICFAYRMEKNGAGADTIVQTPEGFYHMPVFFGAPKRYATLEEAQTAMLATALNPDNVRLR